MAITSIRKVNQYLEVIEDGHSYRYGVDFKDAVVSAILSGQYQVVNIYWDGSVFKATYTDGVTQTTVDIASGAGAGVDQFVELTDAPASYAGKAGKVVAVKSAETGLEFVGAGALNLDGGFADSNYGGTTGVDGGSA